MNRPKGRRPTSRRPIPNGAGPAAYGPPYDAIRAAPYEWAGWLVQGWSW